MFNPQVFASPNLGQRNFLLQWEVTNAETCVEFNMLRLSNCDCSGTGGPISVTLPPPSQGSSNMAEEGPERM